MADRLPRYLHFFRLALLVLAVSTGAVLWLFGRSIGTSRLFDPQHVAVVADYWQFTDALAAEVAGLCSASPIRTVYFDDLDVGLIGTVDRVGRNPVCRTVRETPVTPLTREALLSCSAVIVKEQHPNWADAASRGAALGTIAPYVDLSHVGDPPMPFTPLTFIKRRDVRGLPK